VVALAAALRDGRTTAAAVTERLLARLAGLDALRSGFVTVDAEGARTRAEALDALRRAGRLAGPLHGVPVALKDLCFVRGLPNTCGTARADYWTAAEDCTIARRLVAAGAIVLGKLTMTELAMGTFGVNAVQGMPRNPRAPDRVPGGSSSGCGVALAAGLVAGAIGSDTGGSIRIPAACCGVVGLKPTFGRVSRAGVMPLSASFDHLGPMARSVRDVARLLAVIAGHDPADPASRREPVPDYPALLDRQLTGIRVGVPAGGAFAEVEPDVAAALEEAAGRLAEAGATVVPRPLPDPRALTDATGVIVRAEAAAEHRERLADPEALQPLVRERLRAGVAILAVDYLAARRRVRALREALLEEIFVAVDAVLLPMLPGLPPTVAEATAGTEAEIAARMAAFARFARFANGLGAPALAVPCGASATGVPIAAQLLAAPFAEDVLLRLGAALEHHV
jgi:aspartyl-tRNA(Asn)/glutamyl-tRNA(Gln) amidotransferase subunit A